MESYHFWLNGRNEQLDITNSNQTHSTYVWNEILEKHGLSQTTQLEYNDNKSIIHIENKHYFKDSGLSDREIAVLFNKEDARDYAIKQWNWIRFFYNNIQIRDLSRENMKKIQKFKGIYNIEIMSSGRFLTNIRIGI